MTGAPEKTDDGGGARPRPLDEWHEDYGSVVWWALDEFGDWLGEPAYIGSPLDCGRSILVTVDGQEFIACVGGWPGYHTHWTPHPPFPPLPEPPLPPDLGDGQDPL